MPSTLNGSVHPWFYYHNLTTVPPSLAPIIVHTTGADGPVCSHRGHGNRIWARSRQRDRCRARRHRLLVRVCARVCVCVYACVQASVTLCIISGLNTLSSSERGVPHEPRLHSHSAPQTRGAPRATSPLSLSAPLNPPAAAPRATTRCLSSSPWRSTCACSARSKAWRDPLSRSGWIL